VSDLDLPPRSIRDAVARVQRLADTPRPPDGYPLAWCVEAFYLGDVPALAAATLLADARPEGRPWPIQ
jgi:hypothetical protein